MEFWEREKTRRIQVHVPVVEDRYVLLAIQYMNICVQGVAIGGVVVSSLVLICGLRCLDVSPLCLLFLIVCP
jgi:esterase/lipase